MTLTRKHIALAAAGFGIFALVGGTEIGVADAHSSGAVFANAVCTDHGVWTVDLNVTATNPELHPKATIDNPAGPIVGAPVPYHHQFTIAATESSLEVGVTLAWSDGFAQNLGTFTAQRPEGCTPVVTSTTTTTEPPTTTTVPTYVPPTTIKPIVDSTPPITPTTIWTVDGPTVPVIHTTDGPTTTAGAVARQLPTTGSSAVEVIVVGIAGLVIGVVLLIVTRRKAA